MSIISVNNPESQVHYHDEHGRDCKRQSAVEMSLDGGLTWRPPWTASEIWQQQVKILAAELRSMYPSGSKVELRVLGADRGGREHNESGIFTDATLMAKAALYHSGHAKGVYSCINPVNEVPEGFEFNKMACGKGVKDEQISRRTCLFIDIDALRPDKHQPATETERKAAWKTATDVLGFLISLGWPEPKIRDSGNGFYLLYKIDLSADDDGIVRRILQVLAQKFGNSIDTKVFNPSRISRVVFTWNMKGESTGERAHRLSKPKANPAEWQEVPEALLTELAKACIECEPANQPKSTLGGRLVPADGIERRRSGGSPAFGTTFYAGNISIYDRMRRAEAYQPYMSPAISGSDGHLALFKAIQTILIGFAVPEDRAWPIIHEYNRRCHPLWSESELEHKVHSVLTRSRLPIGYKLEESWANAHHLADAWKSPNQPIGAASPHECTEHESSHMANSVSNTSDKWHRCPKRFASLLRSKVNRRLEIMMYLACKTWACPECSKGLKHHWQEHVFNIFGKTGASIYLWQGDVSDWEAVVRYIRRQRGHYIRIALPGGRLAVASNVAPRPGVPAMAPLEAAQQVAEIIESLPICKKPISTSRGAWQPPKLNLQTELFEHVGTASSVDAEAIRSAAKEFELLAFKERVDFGSDSKIGFVQSWILPAAWTEELIDNFHRHILGNCYQLKGPLAREECQQFLDDLAAMAETG